MFVSEIKKFHIVFWLMKEAWSSARQLNNFSPDFRNTLFSTASPLGLVLSLPISKVNGSVDIFGKSLKRR